MKAAGRKGRPAASVAEKRGDGGPPDGHDPEARPGSAPFPAKFLWMVGVVVMVSCRADAVQQQACHAKSRFAALVKNPK